MKPPSRNIFLFLFGMAWRFGGARRPRMILFYILFLCANICFAFQPLVLEQIINTVQKPGDDAIHRVLMLACLYGSLTVIFWLLHGPARVIERRYGFLVYNNFVSALYRMITDMPLRWHQDHHSGDTINRINKAGRALFNFTQEQFAVIQMTVRFCMSIILLGYFSYWLLGVTLGASFIIALVIRRFDRALIPLGNVTNEREHHLNAALFDYISNIITVLTLRLQGNTRNEIGHRLDAMLPPFKREVSLNEWKWAVVNVLLIITQAGVIGGYITYHFWRHDVMDVGAIVAIFQYLLMIGSVFFSGADIYSRLMQRSIDVHSIDGLMQDHDRLAVPALPVDPSDWHGVKVEGLFFTHHEGEDELHHLCDITLEVKAGQKVALIGTSGSGKTTLLTLLRGLYDAQQVRLTIGGMTHESLRPLSAFTTLVPQDSEIFENTVRYNLTLGTDVPDDLLQQAMWVTTFDGVAKQLPEGLDTDIRERGVNLSGGQKQRLALARGLIAARDSALLLLDEPTSSVDLPTEGIVFDRMFAAFKDKAIVASIHRLHLLPRFDVIGLMADGEMVEQGSFQDLLAKRGAFYNLWQHHLAQSASQTDDA